MTICVDASALIAIIVGESDADALSDRLEADGDRLCSALSVWETVAGLVRSHAFTVEEARAEVQRYLEAGAIRFVPLGERDYDLVIDAYARFGKGRHPASLNMGDCHAYACARARGATLLFKGDDLSRTDVGDVGLPWASSEGLEAFVDRLLRRAYTSRVHTGDKAWPSRRKTRLARRSGSACASFAETSRASCDRYVTARPSR